MLKGIEREVKRVCTKHSAKMDVYGGSAHNVIIEESCNTSEQSYYHTHMFMGKLRIGQHYIPNAVSASFIVI